jgi:hypothetical protein
MELQTLERSFEKMGARLKLSELRTNPWNRRTTPFLINIVNDRKGEHFELAVEKGADVRFNVLNLVPKERHMVLMAATPTFNRVGQKLGESVTRMLLGHDERHWFISGIDGNATTVRDAKQSMKPTDVREAEQGLSARHRDRRRNAARLRQGEWFFIPDPNFVLAKSDWKNPILKNEPISRGRGSKPHMCEQLYRFGGDTVYVRGEAVISPAEYERLEPHQQRGFNQMKRNATVYARGSVKHADHKTIFLNGWHKVLLNKEGAIFGTVSMFLD